jgi:sugar/nucleoside kinase (ribokinase family)
VAQEIPAALARAFAPNVLLGVTPQGWLRAWDSAGLVHATDWAGAAPVLERADALIFSEHDVGDDPRQVQRFVAQARVAVVTQNGSGATVYWEHGTRRRALPAFRVQEVDPTGAGDVFAAAFLLRYYATHDPVESTRYANCVASFAVEGPGTSTLPTPEQVEARLRGGECGARSTYAASASTTALTETGVPPSITAAARSAMRGGSSAR